MVIWLKRQILNILIAMLSVSFLISPNLDGVTVDTIKGLLEVDRDLWKEDAESISELYAKFGDKLPKELAAQLDALKARLG